MLNVTMLQTPSVTLDGVPVSFPFKRADALLYYMLVRRSATRQELISLLWESCDEATGLKNLRNTLYTLKKTLGGDFLLSPQKSLVVVNSAWEVDCDYDRFTQRGDFSAYRGPFLQGFAVKHAFSFDEWLDRTREKLHEQYLGRLAQQAQAALEAGDPEEAARLATEYLREDPFDESMAAFLMERLRAARKYSRAAQVYQRLKEQLSEELGVDPLESTTMLYYEIMNQWNDTTQAPGEAEAPQVPVGRETLYAALRAAAGSFAEGAVRRCSQLFIGEVGSGKSELISHFLRWSDLSALLVLRCGCLQSEEGLPLAPWDRILLSLREFIQEEQLSLPVPVQVRLGQAFPLFRSENAWPGGVSARALRQWDQGLEDSLLLLFSAVTRRKKVLLVLEDLQWADEESLRLGDALLRRLEGRGLMTILTARDDLSPSALARLESLEADGLLRRHRLPPLTPEQTEELLRRELGGEVARRMAPQFHRETGGNLYLLTELTQAYRRSGDVEATLQTLGDILMDRLSGLSGAALQVAELISLFSEEVPSRLLLELMDQNDRLLTAGLDELRGRGIILEHHTEGDPTYRFAHQRIRELVYDRLSYSQRQPLHLQAAELLSQGEQPQEGGACRQIARHFQLAGSRLRALEYRIRACDLDSSRAFEPFSPLGGDAPAPRSPEELEEQTQQFLRELSALRREGADSAVLGRLEVATALIQGRIALFQGDSARGSDILGALSGGSIHPDTGVLIRACYLLASSALYRQATEQVERYTATGMRLLERTRDPVQQAQFQRLRGGLFCLQGAYDKSRYYLLEAMDALRGQPRSTAVRLQLAAVYCDYGRVCRQRLEYADACSYYKRALSLLGDLPWPGGVWVYVHYGRAAFALEDHPRARELFQHGYDNAKVSGELWGRTAASAYTAYYQAMEGDYERAAVSLADAQSCQQRLNSPLEGVILHFVSMHIRSRLDLEQRTGSPLAPLLTYSPESYARQGVRLLSSVPSVFEAEQLSQSLRNGIATQQRYRASELYSKNKHFMAE